MTQTQLLFFVAGMLGGGLILIMLAARDFDRRFNTDANGIPKKPPAG